MRLRTDLLLPLLLANGAGFALAATVWNLPIFKPGWVPHVTSLIILTFTASNLISAIGLGLWSGLIGRIFKAALDGLSKGLTYLSKSIRETNWSLPFGVLIYVASAMALSEAGIAPPLDRWHSFDDATIGFFVRYAALWVLLFLLVFLIIKAARGWYRLAFANLPTVEKHYSVGIARAICLVPTATALAQTISAIVSFEGLAMLFQPRLGDVVYFEQSFSWAGLLIATGATEPSAISLTVTGAEFWAATLAIVLSLGIWLVAYFATQCVIHGEQPTLRMIMVMLLVASVSIVTACYFHYGTLATQADLRAGVKSTDNTVQLYRVQDEAHIQGHERDAASLVAEYKVDLEREIAEVQNDEFLNVVARFEAGLAIYADLDALTESFSADATIWLERAADEVKSGKYTSGEPGDGQVAQNLRAAGDAFRKASASLRKAAEARIALIDDLDRLKNDYSKAMVNLNFTAARTVLDQIGSRTHAVLGLSPESAIGELLAVISTPLLEGERSRDKALAEAQRQALERIEDELRRSAETINEQLDDWSGRIDAFNAMTVPPRVLPDGMRLDLRQEIANLNALRDTLLDTLDERAEKFTAVERMLEDIEVEIDALAQSTALLQDSAAISHKLDNARRDLIRYADYDQEPIKWRVSALTIAKEQMLARLEDEPSYEKIQPFVQLSPFWTLLRYSAVGIIYIALQVTLDLFTLGLVWVISGLRTSPARKPQLEVQCVPRAA